VSAAEAVLRIGAACGGLALVVVTLRSAVRTLLLPRAASDALTETVFRTTRRVFAVRLDRSDKFEDRDARLAMYAPVTLVALLGTWVAAVTLAFGALYYAAGIGSVDKALRTSGSSITTLGFMPVDSKLLAALAYAEALLGLLLVALVISYLPTMYAAFSRREVVVNLLAVRAGTPPSSVELLLRAHRVGMDETLQGLWLQWERWFAELEESHTSLAALVFFRSPHPQHSWITSGGSVLDAAALSLSCLDRPADARPALCLRAGFLALRNIAAFFSVPQNLDPHYPEDPISISRAEFDAAVKRLDDGGLKLKTDRDQMWTDFAGWRVNYDTALLALCKITVAPSAPWSSDRAAGPVEPYESPTPPARRDE
jgi:hypothetical protein